MKTKILIICYFLLVACSSKDEVPGGIMPQDQMVTLLLDIYIAEGKVSDLRIARDSSLAIFDVYEKKLFEKHQLDRKDYQKSITYYYDHPDKFELIYEAVLDSLNLRQEKLKEKRNDGLEDKNIEEIEEK